MLQMDGPGLHYIRRSYRKQAAQVARGSHSGLGRSDGGGVSQVREQFHTCAAHGIPKLVTERSGHV